MKITDDYVFFWGGEYSQWFKSKFTIDGVTFATAEQYMMYRKALLFEDAEIANKILATNNPAEQKLLGRQIKKFDKTVWNEHCRDIVWQGNYAKFTQNPELFAELVSTGNREIVEASPEDRIWGIGLHEDDPNILDKSKWRGTNWLGEAIMKVRTSLKALQNYMSVNGTEKVVN
jgi:hypothetical protein